MKNEISTIQLCLSIYYIFYNAASSALVRTSHSVLNSTDWFSVISFGNLSRVCEYNACLTVKRQKMNRYALPTLSGWRNSFTLRIACLRSSLSSSPLSQLNASLDITLHFEKYSRGSMNVLVGGNVSGVVIRSSGNGFNFFVGD